MYQNADQTPILIAADSLNNINLPVVINSLTDGVVKVFPTISMDGHVFVSSEYGTLINSIEVVDARGRQVSRLINSGYQSEFRIDLPFASGIYYIRIFTLNKVFYKKVVKS